MTIYLTFTALAVSQVMVVLTGNRTAIKFVASATCVAFAVLAALRGLVGTDTWLYENLIAFHIRDLQLQLEPGFLYLIDAAAGLTTNPQVILRSFAVGFFALVVAFVARADRRELVFISAYFAPQYYIFYSMNGVRIGLATAVFLIFYQSVVRAQYGRSAVLGLISLSIHYSILLPASMLMLSRLPEGGRRAGRLRIILVLAASFGAYLAQDQTSERLSVYGEATVTGRFGGFTTAVKLGLVLYAARFLQIDAHRRRRMTWMYGTLGLGAAVLAQYSYAGIRILDLLVWLVPLLQINETGRDTPLPRAYIFCLAAIGGLGALGILRNLGASAGVGNSPFVPYTTIWGGEL